MSTKQIDVAIVGGGLVGMMSAYYLTEDNLNITIFDKAKLATESSWAGGGILTPLYPWRYDDAINALAFRSQTLYPALISQLMADSGLDPEYYTSGMLISAADIDNNALDWLVRHNVPHQKMSTTNYPSLSAGDYYHLPEISQVRNPRLAATLKLALQNKAVNLNENCEVKRIARHHSGGFELSTAQGEFIANNVIVSAGAWSGKILKQLGVSLSVKPVRGQMLLFKADPDFLPTMILAEGKYIIPRRDGHILVGSTMEDVGFDKQTTQVAYDELLNFAQSRCPSLTEASLVKSWAGLRPASPKGVPYVFQHPDIPNLFVNTGHFRNGVVLSPASAELMRDLMRGNTPILPAGDYSHCAEVSAALS